MKKVVLFIMTVFLFYSTTFVLCFVIQTSVSSLDDSTKYAKWDLLPVDFVIDGGTLNGKDGEPLVISSLDTWDNVPTAKDLSGNLYVYVDDNDNPIDFTIDNFGIDYGIVGDGINEIVFDETGNILENLGLDPDTVAGIGITIEDTKSCRIIDAMLVANGTMSSNSDLDMQATLVHELGHIWGLSHTFVGAVNTVNGEPGLYPIDPEAIPTMYPWENPVNDAYGRSLEPDDEAAISMMYPENSYDPPEKIPFGSDSGTIEGKVMYMGEVPITGVNVRAVNVDNPGIQISSLSGYDGKGTGEFRICGLPPGRYFVLTEGIDGRDGITAKQIEDDGIGACCFDGFQDIDYDSTIVINEGEIHRGIEFDITSLHLDNDDAVEFGLPDGFEFNFAGRDVHRIFLYSNGMISLNRYEDSDPQYTVPGPDLSDFLSRPIAKICPLKCDLDPGGNSDFCVDVSYETGHIVFSFDHVPVANSSRKVSFDLVLDKTGNFHFNYGNVDGAKALVGYTPGVFMTGGLEPTIDFIPFLDSTFPSGKFRIAYQILDSSKLSDHSVDFETPSPGAFYSRNRLVFPWLAYSAYYDTGISLVNNLDTDCRVRITAFGEDGTPAEVKQGITNPVIVKIPAFCQYVTQVSQLFKFEKESIAGWILVESESADPLGVEGFFLAQSIDDGMLTGLDGSNALVDTDTTVIFPRFTSLNNEYTEVTIINPNAISANITLHLYGDDGSDNTSKETIPPNGAGIYPVDGNSDDAYVLVDSDIPICGFAMNYNQSGSLAGQASHFLWEARKKLISPHFIAMPGVFSSKLDLVNPNEDNANVTVTLLDSKGTNIGIPVQLSINGWFHKSVEINSANFNLSSEQTNGSVVITSDQPILGDETFGSPEYESCQTTMPLLHVPFWATLNAHLAQGTVGGVNYLTGLALFSNGEDNRITVTMYDSKNDELSSVTENFEKNERHVGLLSEWMDNAPWPQIGGFLITNSSKGVFSYEIFTTEDSRFFASVPSLKVLPLYSETNDPENGFPDTADIIDKIPIEITGKADVDDTGYFFIDVGQGETDEIEDLYKIQISKNGLYLFSLYPENRYCDMDIYLLDDKFNVIGVSVNGVPSVEYLDIELDPGTYYVGVSLFDPGWFTEGKYWLTIEPDAIN